MRLRVWCERHWKPYQDGRANGARATTQLVSAFTNTLNMICHSEQEFWGAIQQTHDAGKPLCCLLDEPDHDELIMNAGPADPERPDVAAEAITVEPRYGDQQAANG